MLLWTPSEEFQQRSVIRSYMAWVAEHRQLAFCDYADLWTWSVTDLPAFWESVVAYFGVEFSEPYTRVLGTRTMPGASWFEDSRLNFAANVFRHASDSQPALIFASERSKPESMSWAELRSQVAAVATFLRERGVGVGDRVVGYLPNTPAAVVGFLATASVGAIWSNCSPDFGSGSALDRFSQIQPRVLFAVDGYEYGGRWFDRRSAVSALRDGLPSLEVVVRVPASLELEPPQLTRPVVYWEDVLRSPANPLTFASVPFDHPLWVVYSSGTTGLPKPIVHGHGGILVEDVKVMGLHLDTKPGERLFWYSSSGWIMWNLGVIGSLAAGVIPVLYDGSAGYPDMHALWQLVEQTESQVFGSSAAFLTACMKGGLQPGTQHDLRHLRTIGSTGSPLPEEVFEWTYRETRPDIWLISTSGGTDIASGFVGGCALLPVYSGEIQCRCLGVKVEAFDPAGKPLVGEVGELVVTEPMPSMPLFFWNDAGNERYRESYFSMYPGVWRHGDWIEITPRGSAIIRGRSDSTLNRLGVRMGSAEIYSAVEALPEVVDSLVVGIELPGGGYYMPLFVVASASGGLDDELRARIAYALRTSRSPRHVPDEMIEVSAIPRTLTGKKLEVPVKKILMGCPPQEALSLDATANPDSIRAFVELAGALPSLAVFR